MNCYEYFGTINHWYNGIGVYHNINSYTVTEDQIWLHRNVISYKEGSPLHVHDTCTIRVL